MAIQTRTTNKTLRAGVRQKQRKTLVKTCATSDNTHSKQKRDNASSLLNTVIYRKTASSRNSARERQAKTSKQTPSSLSWPPKQTSSCHDKHHADKPNGRYKVNANKPPSNAGPGQKDRLKSLDKMSNLGSKSHKDKGKNGTLKIKTAKPNAKTVRLSLRTHQNFEAATHF